VAPFGTACEVSDDHEIRIPQRFCLVSGGSCVTITTRLESQHDKMATMLPMRPSFFDHCSLVMITHLRGERDCHVVSNINV
jgi:hypothetical protein